MRERRKLWLPAWHNPQTQNDSYAIINPSYWTDLTVKSWFLCRKKLQNVVKVLPFQEK